MIITRTPFRISFFGGGTDYPGWYLKHGRRGG
jgi:D-glycero-alpha-D-manno-heptose-7-phosphate kinase